jgi:hypothetical protein
MALSPIMRAAYALYKAGFRGKALVNQLAIDGRESHYDPNAENLTYPDHSEGYGQINQLAHHGRFGTDAQLKRPFPNAVAQWKLSQGGRNLGPWKGPSGSWTDGITASMFSAARKAAAAVEGGGGGMATGTPARNVTKTVPGVDRSALRSQLISQFVLQGGPDNPDALLGLATSLPGAKDTPARTVRKTIPGTPGTPGSSQGAATVPLTGAGGGVFKITGANPSRLTKPLVSFAKKVAGVYGHPLTGDSGATHSKYTVDGNVSDHWSGNATDIPATGQTLINMGRAALIAAGMPRAEAMKQTGGLFNVGGHQVIFNTHLGGDHTNHLHVSV